MLMFYTTNFLKIFNKTVVLYNENRCIKISLFFLPEFFTFPSKKVKKLNEANKQDYPKGNWII